MSHINVDFSYYFPKMSTVYSLFEVLQTHGFIQRVEVVQEQGKNNIKILRK